MTHFVLVVECSKSDTKRCIYGIINLESGELPIYLDMYLYFQLVMIKEPP